MTAVGGLADSVVQTDALVAALEGAGEEANRVSDEMDAGLGGSWRRLLSSVQGFAIVFAKAMDLAGTMEAAKNVINGWTKWFKENWTSVTNKIAELWLIATTHIEWAWSNMGNLFQIVIQSMALKAVTWFNEIIYFFTVVLPASAKWFGENLFRVMLNTISAVGQLFIDLKDNVKLIFKSIWEFITSKDDFHIDFKPLLKDMKTVAMTKLEIPDRVRGDVEKHLEQSLGALVNATENSLDNMMSDRLATLHQMQDEAAAKKLDDTQPEDPVGKVRTASEGGPAGPSGTSTASVAGAQMRGSAEAMMTILKSAGAQTDEMQLKIQKKLLKEQTAARKIAEEQEKRARRIEAERERNNGQYLVISGTP